VGVGWNVADGYPLRGPIDQRLDHKQGWRVARNALINIEIKDWIVVTLPGHRIAKLGAVVEKKIEDDEWDPLIPVSKDYPKGANGRRILLRWDLSCGPEGREMAVQLPRDHRLNSNELNGTIKEIRSISIDKLKAAMNDPVNWVSLSPIFRYEQALSDYVAAFPHRLEDGLLPHPDDKIRERIFDDKRRLDVLLVDRNGCPVIVECKQQAPTVNDVDQLRHYMSKLKGETGLTPRGILVHAGSRKLDENVLRAANQGKPIDVLQYRLDLEFYPCN
jgi:hypothetical protein